MSTFYQNFIKHPKSRKLIESSKLYLSSKKKPIGYGKSVFTRIDGVYFHNFFRSDKLNKKINYILFNRNILKNYYKSKKIIFQSEFSKKTFFKILNPKLIKESTIIYNGSKEIADNPELYNEKDSLKIITCSVDHPTKRLHYFFELEKQLKKINIDCEITIITSSINYKQKIFAKMQNFKSFQKDLSNIFFKYNLSKDEVFEELLKSHLYVSFSHIDPCPNSIIEAISVGLPIIAPSSGGIPELSLPELLYEKKIYFDYINLFNYEPINQEEIALAIEKIVTFLKKKEYFYNRSLVYKSNFTLDKMIDSYVNYMS